MRGFFSRIRWSYLCLYAASAFQVSKAGFWWMAMPARARWARTQQTLLSTNDGDRYSTAHPRCIGQPGPPPLEGWNNHPWFHARQGKIYKQVHVQKDVWKYLQNILKTWVFEKPGISYSWQLWSSEHQPQLWFFSFLPCQLSEVWSSIPATNKN